MGGGRHVCRSARLETDNATLSFCSATGLHADRAVGGSRDYRSADLDPAAREQAKTVKCIANLKEIGNAMHMYFTENNDWFPFEKRNWPGGYVTPLHGFYYGGHPGRHVPLPDDPDNWWGYTDADFRDTPRGRPFNPYVYDNLSGDLDDPRDQGEDWFEQRRKMPIYECPSDMGGFWNTDNPNAMDHGPIHYETGSSYDMNYHFLWQWSRAQNMSGELRLYCFMHYLERGNRFIAKQRERAISRFIMLFEDPFDNAQWTEIQRVGWHKKWSRHSCLFLDGHAANLYMDTAHENSGPGWKSTPYDWYEDPTDPDYDLRLLPP
jgi:hypothetical protein